MKFWYQHPDGGVAGGRTTARQTRLALEGRPVQPVAMSALWDAAHVALAVAELEGGLALFLILDTQGWRICWLTSEQGERLTRQ